METMDIDSQEAPELWRNRDAATKLFARERLTSSHSGLLQDMPLAASFDVDTCLARLRRDKASVVRDAFGAAAYTVLLALEKDENKQREAHSSSRADTAPFLPPLVQKWQQLQDVRTKSMTQVCDAKEKRTIKSTTASRGPSRAASPKPGPSTKPTALMPTSAATSDSRLIVSRAVLCTAASITFDRLTPAYEGHDLDVIQVPQNNEKNTSSQGSMPPTVNMGAVKLQAQTLGDRVATLTANSTRRSRQRYDYRRDNARYAKSPRSVLQISNPFSLKSKENVINEEMENDDGLRFPPNPMLKGAGVTEEWKSVVLPRFKAVLQTGCGHAVYCDVEWHTRHGRIANLLNELSDESLGPHLIITTRPQVEAFAQEFESIDSRVRLVSSTSLDTRGLTVLTYAGSKARRRKLRDHFPSATGLRDSSFHVMVMSYTDFLEDYLHVCQLPYQAVILDEGWSFLAAAHIDSVSSIGALWEHGMFCTAGQHFGLAGTMQKFWDFSVDEPSREQVKTACTGLTARHRILTTRSVYAGSRDSRHQGPVPSLVKFLIPHFPDVVRDEWDRSKIETDGKSMEHMRKLAARSIIVYHPNAPHDDLYKLALDGLNGLLTCTDRSQEPNVPVVIDDETFISENKALHSRRSALACFGQIAIKSWLRYELGSASFKVIEEAIRRSGAHGYVCEEIVTASSLTSSGATGAVCGTMAYRLAVRCGRSFGSELGLRQHLAAMHAPPGTWLCRTCGVDCGTSPSRTAHERGCGQPPPGADEPVGIKGGDDPSTVQGTGTGQKQLGPPSVVGKKAKKKKGGPSASAAGPKEKDSDGSFRVPGYRGVWVNPAGKHFVKIGGERLKKDDSNDVLYFDSTDDAAKKYDELIRERGLEKSDGLNFNEDGTRIVHEDNNPAAAAGRGFEIMGGGASSVVPALSVINIKDLPKDVTPLLRDPRQTSRTGGNSKRHVYAYRGVCRQARKGHDRWQSQISFSGTNHYLGTFDSEWDAAAIYAWAHLILYGEEATRKARLEGEEAAAAYEQEKKDIAAGKVVAPPPKPAKKKRKKDEKKTDDEIADEKTPKPKKKRAPNQSKINPVSIAEANPLLSKAAISVPILAPRKEFETMDDSEMIRAASARMEAARAVRNRTVESQRPHQVPLHLRPCVAMASVLDWTPPGGAMLMGLSPLLFGWNTESFLSSQDFESPQASQQALVALNNEYGINRFNDSFRTIVQGTICVIGRANERTERAWDRLRFGTPVPLGTTAGELDCNVGGLMGSCSETAATIVFCPSGDSAFQFRANNDKDIVTLNGRRIRASTGSFPLFNEDVCTVGARVFVFLLPTGA